MRSRRRQRGWLSFFTGLTLGLFVALLVYLRVPVPGDAEPRPPNESRPPDARGDEAEIAPSGTKKPRFDFYTILPEMEVKVPDWEVGKETPNPPPEKLGQGGAYTLQIGSFQRYEEADRAKARLALIGIPADIQRVVINGKDTWHRVRVGPFQDLDELQAMRARLAEHHVGFMLLRMKPGDAPSGR